MTIWQRIKAFFGFYEPPSPPAAVAAEAKAPIKKDHPTKKLYTGDHTKRIGKAPYVKPISKKDDGDSVTSALAGAALGYALGSSSSHHHSDSSSSSSSWDSGSSSGGSSDFGSFSGGGGDFGGGGASGGFGD